MIRQKLEEKGYTSLKEASKYLGISSELLRVTLNKEHIPKDKILDRIARKLNLDPSALILEAHREKVPTGVKGYFLSPKEKNTYSKKRKWPLSEEQCDHIGKVMTSEEIQVTRMLRQVTDDAKVQIMGYITFMFTTKRKEISSMAETDDNKAKAG